MRFSEFSKMPQPRLKPVDVNELLRAVLKDFEPQFRAVGRPPITPELYLATASGKIQGDADLLRKALENLLLHSIDTMPAGGTLTIRTAQVQRNRAHRDFRQRRGPGSRAGSARRSVRSAAARRRARDSGCRRRKPIVSDHGGRFFAETVPGVGTTFRLEFAVAPDASRLLQPTVSMHPAARPGARCRRFRRSKPKRQRQQRRQQRRC